MTVALVIQQSVDIAAGVHVESVSGRVHTSPSAAGYHDYGDDVSYQEFEVSPIALEAAEYPVLAKLWDNDDDDAYEDM